MGLLVSLSVAIFIVATFALGLLFCQAKEPTNIGRVTSCR